MEIRKTLRTFAKFKFKAAILADGEKVQRAILSESLSEVSRVCA